MDSVVQVFNVIVTFIGTIVEGISGISALFVTLFKLVLELTKILPDPFYPCFVSFASLYSTILIYKLIRKG